MFSDLIITLHWQFGQVGSFHKCLLQKYFKILRIVCSYVPHTFLCLIYQYFTFHSQLSHVPIKFLQDKQMIFWVLFWVWLCSTKSFLLFYWQFHQVPYLYVQNQKLFHSLTFQKHNYSLLKPSKKLSWMSQKNRIFYK